MTLQLHSTNAAGKTGNANDITQELKQNNRDGDNR